MSIKAPRNIVIMGVVIAAVLACTVLLANYSNILPVKADDASQVKSCSAGAGGPACAMASADNQAGACSAAKSCPPDCDKPCCAEDGQAACPMGVPKPCCPAADVKACPPDCDKPCCAEDGQAACPMGVPKPCCPAADVKACPPDCDKPCCAEQTDVAGSVQGCCGAAAACSTGN